MNAENPAGNAPQVADMVRAICTAHPDTQAIYLYGSWGTEHQRQDSDLDIAVLLPPTTSKNLDRLAWATLGTEIAAIAGVEVADLIDLHTASTILSKEVVFSERLVYCADEYAKDQFEMLTLSFYQKLNEERRAIVEDGLKAGRFYDV